MGVGLYAKLRMCECIDELLGGVYMLHLTQVLVSCCSCSCMWYLLITCCIATASSSSTM